ncbi:hypothetical protein Fmac_001698 [Flemingia macrophylla]|uniref:CCHC-type domain-containing protein n=1 Tax=Flemingia macrophylla TaxID=520843 RepID=A0ABD1NHU6_9FABA
MANNQLPFAEGAFINRPHLFCGDNYSFWKVRMKIFMESVHRSIWQAVVTDYKVPTKINNGKEVEKPFEDWDQNEIRRAENDAKALNIIHSSLNSDEFFRISACITAKEAWELIKVTHEGTPEVRRARKNALIQEYEMFRMSQGEIIMDVQKRFTHIVNNLKGLDKKFDEEEVNVKILKSLNRKWQPTVTAITESKNLSQMTSAELFGKLREYEMDMFRIFDEEQKDNKARDLALKTGSDSSESESTSCESGTDEEEIRLIVKKFKKFMRKNNNRKRQNFSRKNFKKNENSSTKFTCYECGKFGHIKSECPNLKKCFNSDQKRPDQEDKKKDRFKKKRAYIAWDDNDCSTSSESEEEQTNPCLMIRQNSDDEVSNNLDSSTCDYNELHDVFCELYKEAKKLKKLNKSLRNTISDLEKMNTDLKNDFEKVNNENDELKKPCLNCITLTEVLRKKSVRNQFISK